MSLVTPPNSNGWTIPLSVNVGRVSVVEAMNMAVEAVRGLIKAVRVLIEIVEVPEEAVRVQHSHSLCLQHSHNR
jgi:hypothetical protein